ncbi:ABC transporter substrate-binding protein [Oxalobacteraceae bacterium CAVE-383]|nr:ABC transporter substrate-binding protein [Oxalobacteraceae bacterium CAVE-383]
MKKTLGTLLVAGLTLAASAGALADNLKLYAAAGVKSPVERMAADYEKSSGQKITLIFDTAGGAQERFLADPQATFLITGATRINSSIKNGELKNGAVTVVGDTVGGFAAPPGAPKPDISTTEKFKAALLGAKRIVFSDPARGATVGLHFMKVIEAMGIKDEILKKATLAPDGLVTMQLVLDGKADLAVTQLSEIVQANPEALVGPFPPEYDLSTTYSLWLHNEAPASAKAFAKLITSPAERAKLESYGLRPPK